MTRVVTARARGRAGWVGGGGPFEVFRPVPSAAAAILGGGFGLFVGVFFRAGRRSGRARLMPAVLSGETKDDNDLSFAPLDFAFAPLRGPEASPRPALL